MVEEINAHQAVENESKSEYPQFAEELVLLFFPPNSQFDIFLYEEQLDKHDHVEEHRILR